MSTSQPSVGRFGLLANSCVLGSLLMCFGQSGIALALGTLGVMSADLVPHVQSLLMWGLAALVVLGLALDRRQHGERTPLVIGTVGLAIQIGTLYVYYDWRILTFAYLLIVAAVFLNQNVALRGLVRTVRAQSAELQAWNQTLAERVAEQIEKNAGLERLKRFLSPHVAQLVTQSGNEAMLASHRRFIATVFCDLRGFTSFSESIEPEEAMRVLQHYHAEMGKLVAEYDGTIDHRAGDGLMVIFNDPVPCDAPAERAVRMSLAMRTCMATLGAEWRRRGYPLGFGVGLSVGYATLGVVGYEGRFDYTANGNDVNLAARLCDKAQDGQIIASHAVFVELEQRIDARPLGELGLKGVHRSSPAYEVLGWRGEAQPLQ